MHQREHNYNTINFSTLTLLKLPFIVLSELQRDLKILMIEDLDEDADLIVRVLNKENFNFSYIRVDSRERLIAALESFSPDLILCDHSLPQFNSIEALNICQRMELATPFILVTGAVSEEFAVMCIKNGADDYVLKSNLSRLPLAIRMALKNRQKELIRLQQQEILRKQNEELLKINRELDSFVYSVSHNLRSPLSSILGLINISRMEGRKINNEAPGQYLELMERSVMKLDDTIKEILDYSHNSRSELDISEISLEKLIYDTFEQLKYLTGSNEVQKEIRVEKRIKFYTDAHRLKVILANLISNAIKFRDALKEKQVVRILADVSPDKVVLEIHDNGIGIPESLLPNVYKMFYRGTEKSEGPGLGLYIVKETVARLNGEIEIKSIVNWCTTVVVQLPNMKS